MENGGNKRKAALDAGYSQNTADNPDKILQSKAFKEYLDAVGLTDENLSLQYREMVKSRVIETFNVPYALIYKKIKGKKKQSLSYSHVPHEEIVRMFESESGFKVNIIIDDDVARVHKVMCWIPNRTSRDRAVELTSKARNVLKDDKYDLTLHHIVSEAERGAVVDIFGGNKKNENKK